MPKIEHPKYRQSRHQREREHRDREEHEAHLAAINSVANELATTKKQTQADDDKKAFRDKLTIGLLILTVIAAGSGDVIFYCTMQDARVAANTQHIDTLAALNKTDAIMKIDQRAWVGVEYIQPVPSIPAVGKSFAASIRLKNTGKTPAQHIAQSGYLDPVKTLNDINFSKDGENKQADGVLMPGGEITIPVTPLGNAITKSPAIFTQELIDYIGNDEGKIVAHGRIDYNDIFGDPHWITYCGFLRVPFDGSFAFCDTHNDTDNYR